MFLNIFYDVMKMRVRFMHHYAVSVVTESIWHWSLQIRLENQRIEMIICHKRRWLGDRCKRCKWFHDKLTALDIQMILIFYFYQWHNKNNYLQGVNIALINTLVLTKAEVLYFMTFMLSAIYTVHYTSWS